ncbi:hypothetical protein DRO69_01130 [Candidatus Bathyarchaeota archaeon]|nr:MAG: hypothetical protein DRO69_01130 [Candidatus Bathyarchaeota archaeon]
MVAPVFEHITAIMVVSMLFVSAVIAVPAISYVNLLYVDQQQLRNVALEALNSMLLSKGYPSNWGSNDPFNESDVAQFGLALSEDSSFYVLDPDKVQRLNVGNPSGSLDYETVRTLLGLQDYGFNIKIMPPFNVTAIKKSGSPNLLYEVNVTFNDGRPIPNAHVEATILYVENKKDYFTTETENSTNLLGQCTIEKVLPSGITDYVIVLKVTVADLATVTSTYMEGFGHQHTTNASIIGENISLSIPEGPGWEKGSAGERWVESIAVVSADGTWRIYNGSHQTDPIQWSDSKNGWAWSRVFSGLSDLNPLFIIFNLSVPNPRQLVLFVGPFTTASGYRVFNFGSSSAQSPSGGALKLSRSVEIAGMTYIFELLLWKEV